MAKELYTADVLASELVKITFKGPVQGWTNRLSEIAAQLGIELGYINWNESPYNVAQQIVRRCTDRISRQRLTDLISPGFLNHRSQIQDLPPKVLERGKYILKLLFHEVLEVHKGQYLEVCFDNEGKVVSVTTGRLPKE